MDINYNAVVDAVINGTKQEQIFEELKQWYEKQGVKVYYIAKNANNDQYYPGYKLSAYCDLKNTKYEKSTRKADDLACDAFSQFLTLCEKYDLFIDDEWDATMVFNHSIDDMVKEHVLSDFCKTLETEMSSNEDISRIEDYATVMVVFKTDESLINYSKSGKTADMTIDIKDRFEKYVTELEISKYCIINNDVTVNFSSDEI